MDRILFTLNEFHHSPRTLQVGRIDPISIVSNLEIAERPNSYKLGMELLCHEAQSKTGRKIKTHNSNNNNNKKKTTARIIKTKRNPKHFIQKFTPFCTTSLASRVIQGKHYFISFALFKLVKG